MVILDNFGTLIAGLFRTPDSNRKDISLKGSGGAIGTYSTYASTAGGVFNDTDSGSTREPLWQIGKGTTPATRQDFKIESGFTTPPPKIHNREFLQMVIIRD